MKPPAIFLVGEVVRLREQLQWFDNKPLFGKTVIVTRARAQASALTKKLEAQGAKVIEAPAIKIVPAADYAPLDNAIANINDYKWLVFTSANGVDYFFERLGAAKKDARALANVKLAAIGSMRPSIVYSAALIAGDKILLARAKVAREVLPESLRKIGAIVDVVTAYETVADCENKDELIEALESGEASIVTFTSSSTVTNLLEVLGDKKELLNKAALAAIGPVTADTLKKHGYTPAINAAEYTIDGLMTAITNFYNK